MADERDEVRSRVDIVDLVGQSIKLKKIGRNWKGLCPFHSDSDPSLHVSAEYGRFTCWACGAKGDVFDWVMRTQNVEFREALELLARQAGITLTKNARGTGASTQQRSAMDEALFFFRHSLETNDIAKSYCKERGLDDECIKSWEIGYAPDVGEALATHLQRKGHKLSECQELFLVERDKSGGYFDKFRGRLMFPIRNERGDLVAFGGRILGNSHPKYINSSDTPLYKKSKVLYGLNIAKSAIAESDRALICEGYLDVIACHQAGVRIAVASLGTALSEDHARLLRRWAPKASIFYDGDEAGCKAAERTIEILEHAGIEVLVVPSPKGSDPDTLLRSGGNEAVAVAVNSAETPLDFRLRLLEERLSPASDDFWREVYPVLASAKLELELARHVVRLSHQYPGLRDPIAAQKALRKQIADLRKSQGKQTVKPQPVASVVNAAPKLHKFELSILHSLSVPSIRARAFAACQEPDLFLTDCGRAYAEAIVKTFGSLPPKGPPSEWLHSLPDETREAFILPDDQPHPTLAYLEDAIAALDQKRRRRNLQTLKQGDSDDRLANIQQHLENLQELQEQTL